MKQQYAEIVVGMKIGLLEILSKTKLKTINKQKAKGFVYNAASVCKCDCGKVVVMRDNNLKTGTYISCGCVRKKRLLESNIVHNMSKSKLYSVWGTMHDRCYLKTAKAYVKYGGRGIIVCEKWHTFVGFFEDMGATYQEGLSIERIDVNGNYCKENCIWIPKNEQSKNTRQVNLYFYEDKWWLSTELMAHLNLSYREKLRRLNLPTKKLYEDG